MAQRIVGRKAILLGRVLEDVLRSLIKVKSRISAVVPGVRLFLDSELEAC